MIPALIVFLYLALVLYVGIFAFRGRSGGAGGTSGGASGGASGGGGGGKEDFFLANRGLGTFVFLLSLFGSNMTSFAILGSSGLAFRQGIGVYGLMASISGIVIPASIFLIGTRLWAIGKRLGHITQVQILRDRFEMGHIGTLLVLLQAVLLVPYIIIGVMGGGETLEGVSHGAVPYWLGGLVVALVVMSYVFFGGMRGTAWVNTLQTLMFLVFGTVAFLVVARGMGGLREAVARMAGTLDAANAAAAQGTGGAGGPLPLATDGALLTRHRIPFWYYASYTLIPLSSIMFPHIAIFCLTAKRLASFKKTVVLYPLCIMALWLPAVFLGAIAGGQPRIVATLAAGSEEARAWRRTEELRFKPESSQIFVTPWPGSGFTRILLASEDVAAKQLVQTVRKDMPDEELAAAFQRIKDPKVKAEIRRLANTNADGVMLDLLGLYAPGLLAGVLGAAIMACVMASDSQILALSTMWSQDVYAWYGLHRRFGGRGEVWSARAFVVGITVIAYAIALTVHAQASIFEIAIQYAFSGYASLAPIMLACLFWRRATKWGVLASTLWVAAWLVGGALLQANTDPPPVTPPGGARLIWSVGGVPIFFREAVRVSFTEARVLLVVPMFVGAGLLLVAVSWLTRPPSRATIERYFGAASA